MDRLLCAPVVAVVYVSVPMLGGRNVVPVAVRVLLTLLCVHGAFATTWFTPRSTRMYSIDASIFYSCALGMSSDAFAAVRLGYLLVEKRFRSPSQLL